MMISTRDFGSVQIAEEDIITFKQPIFGFEELTKYVILWNENISNHFVWLQSLEDKDICFILANPQVVVDNYTPDLPDITRKLLGKDEEYMYWLIVVAAENLKDSTVNLKSPVIVNPKAKCAVQVILEQDLPIRFPLINKEKENEEC